MTITCAEARSGASSNAKLHLNLVTEATKDTKNIIDKHLSHKFRRFRRRKITYIKLSCKISHTHGIRIKPPPSKNLTGPL